MYEYLQMLQYIDISDTLTSQLSKNKKNIEK